MSKIWITSDSHFRHNKPFLYEPRHFNSIETHDKAIIENWNKLVAPDDIIYLLGDVIMNDLEGGMECLRQLNGNIKIIRGNHDTDNKVAAYSALPNVEVLGYAHMLKYGKYHFYLSHYPTLTSNLDEDKPLKQGVINLCGHSHTQNRFGDMGKGLIYHCELDAHQNCPVLLDNIIEDLKAYLTIC